MIPTLQGSTEKTRRKLQHYDCRERRRSVVSLLSGALPEDEEGLIQDFRCPCGDVNSSFSRQVYDSRRLTEFLHQDVWI